MEFLINITIKSSLILLFSGSLLLALKNASATLRHWVISLTMIGLLGLPLLTLMIPDISVTIPYLPAKQASKAPTTISKITAVEETAMIGPEITYIAPAVLHEKAAIHLDENLEITDNQYHKLEQLNSVTSKKETISWASLYFGVWLIGCLFFMLKALLGYYLIRNITIKSVPFSLPKKLHNCLEYIAIEQVRCLSSIAIKTPMTWGGFKPVILLPTEAKSWSDIDLKTVLLHELNHIKRNDYWWHNIGLLAVCLYWYNPLMWLMKKQQLLEREKACDEAVLRAGIQQQNYAEQLVNMAKQLAGKTSMISENGLPMAKVSQTKSRILAILKFDQQRFSFSKWKQWNWGLFYACLFPVLAAFSPVGAILQEQFELPELEALVHFLPIRETNNSVLPIDFEINGQRIEEESGQKEKEFGQLDTLDADRELTIENLPIHLLTKPNEFLPIKEITTKIDIQEKRQKTGLFGKWKVGKSEFTIWTYGEFKIIPTPPYVEVVDTSGIVFIEEYIPGLFSDKINQLTIGKAAVEGRMEVGYKGKLSAPIAKGTPIKVWSDNTNYERWMATKGKELPTYLLKKQEEKVIKEVTAENSEWLKRIVSAKKWLNGFFVPTEKMLEQVEIKDRRLVFELGKIPYKGLDIPQENLITEIIGRNVLPVGGNGGTIGNLSTNPKGIRYVTLLKGKKRPALVKAFNFHLAENDFKNVKFSLQLYNVVDGEIDYAITKQPIPITLKADEKGWIKMDLSAYDIVTKGDVLVVLTNNGFSGTKNRKKLYFSLAEDHQNYQQLLVGMDSWKTKIWEKDFIMYLNVEQDTLEIKEIKKLEENPRFGAVNKNDFPSNLSARKIVETAINRLKDNYIQKPYNADLFFRYSSLNQADSLGYQSEALLKFYDSAGYQKKGWRNAASTRHIRLEQGRILVGKQADKMELKELGRLFFFWTHEPIITRDKPLSESSVNAYNFKLIGTKIYEGKNVWEIEFVCTKLKDRYAGLPSLKYMKGKFYINQADYAVLEYQQQYLMDYEWKGKHPEKRGHLKERNIIESSRIEKFSKNKDGYYLDYAKSISNEESQHTLLDGKKNIHKGRFIEEQQYFNLTTENVEPLNKNLNNLNKEITYNPDFWEQFNIVLNGQ